MGPPGGGRNDISDRFTRHTNIISIDSFDDNTMTKIFTSIVDWHFAKGFDASFGRLGKVRFVIIAGPVVFYHDIMCLSVTEQLCYNVVAADLCDHDHMI